MGTIPWIIVGSTIYRLSVIGLFLITFVMMLLTMFRLLTELFAFTEPAPAAGESGEGGGIVQRVVYRMPPVIAWFRIVLPAMMLAAIFSGFILSPIFPQVMPAFFPTDSGTGDGVRTWISIQEIVSRRIEGIIKSILSMIST